MISTSPRAAVSLWLLLGLLGGCASAGSKVPPATPKMSTVTSDDIERNGSDRTIEELLQAKSPGVLITHASGGGIAVQIRGPSSFMSSNEPLYILDGMAIEPGPGGTITGINPHDIASIEVLKRPEEIAMYGVRGANGVIVIKTKKPGRANP